MRTIGQQFPGDDLRTELLQEARDNRISSHCITDILPPLVPELTSQSSQ